MLTRGPRHPRREPTEGAGSDRITKEELIAELDQRLKLPTLEDLREAIVHGAVKRIRPNAMTVAAAFLGLMPIMWSNGTGADMMKRVVAPMVGGLVTSFVLELLVYPPVYEVWKWRFEMKLGKAELSR